jgi:hypothetical protein
MDSSPKCVYDTSSFLSFTLNTQQLDDEEPMPITKERVGFRRGVWKECLLWSWWL